MNNFLPNVLRSSVTDIMMTLLLLMMARPKYGKRVTILVTASIVFVNMCINIYFYQTENYTALFKVDACMIISICIILKFLLHDDIMQWFFIFLTATNVLIIITVLSYVISQFMPYPAYSNILLRLLLFTVILVLFYIFLRPLYRKVVEHWYLFCFISLGLFINFAYYIYSSRDILKTITGQFVPLFLLIILSIIVYVTLFYSLKAFSSEADILEENIKIKAQQDILKTELDAYEDFIAISKQYRHDLRHHNALLLEYLACGNVDGARSYLQQYDKSIEEAALCQYCKNPVVNTVLRLYERKTRQNDIKFVINVDIPEKLPLTAVETGTLFSNILENALEACLKSNLPELCIDFTATSEEELLKIQVKNSCSDVVTFEHDLPKTTKQGGGTGVKSIVRIVKKCDGMVDFIQKDNIFFIQLILPLN
jgi:hypothetical protein